MRTSLLNYKNILFAASFWVLISFIPLTVCSKNPGPTEPTPDDPVPCEPVPCETVRVQGVWHISWGNSNDSSFPNLGGLLQNDIVIWSIIDNEFRSETLEVLVVGDFHPEDRIEAYTRGSNSRMSYLFQKERDKKVIK